MEAAEAAHCAQDQDKFWEYHDLLYDNAKDENAGDFKRENLDKFAGQLGLNATQFGQCMDTHKYEPFVEAQGAEAQRVGIASTPTLIINRQKITGFTPFNTQRFDRELLIAPGVELANQVKLNPGATVCLAGQLDDNRRILSGTVSDPPGGEQTTCGLVKSFNAATPTQVGTLILEQDQLGLKQLIDRELQSRR